MEAAPLRGGFDAVAVQTSRAPRIPRRRDTGPAAGQTRPVGERSVVCDVRLDLSKTYSEGGGASTRLDSTLSHVQLNSVDLVLFSPAPCLSR